ncbi:hypothetical protein FPZ43_16920 [Mucilaginibacter pallidiroseus]|uniref:Uncharacterized protein n=2 Tax=Mucilaginibacter pallidiroseus TaxID=2599295 RepID=A0A563U0W8_9SPHI|nr:hypothetical protein FPZ43_16920 [Mucilaginibacter pallidiroseus]
MVAIQVLFLFMIVRENLQSNIVCAVVIVLSALMLVAHVKQPLHYDDHLYEHILVALWIPVGAVSSYYINNKLGLGPVIGAATVGLIASFLPALNQKSAYLKHLPPAVYCGAFIGMSGVKVANGFLFVFAASFFAGILLVLSKSLFQGMGGKLGLLAFAGVVMASLCLFIMSSYGL